MDEKDFMKQEKIPVMPENPETQQESSPETPEDLKNLAESKIADAENKVNAMKTEGAERLAHADDTVDLSAEKTAEIKQKTGIIEEIGKITQEANETKENMKTAMSAEDQEDAENLLMSMNMLKEIKARKGENLPEFIDQQKIKVENELGSDGVKKVKETEDSKILKAGLDMLGNMKKVEKGEETKELDVEGLPEEVQQNLKKANENIINIKSEKKDIPENEKGMSLRCPKCGSENSSGSNFCQDCTEPISEKGVFLDKARKEFEKNGIDDVPFAELTARAEEIKKNEQQEMDTKKGKKQVEQENQSDEIKYDIRQGEKGLDLKIGLGADWEGLDKSKKVQKFDAFLEKFKNDIDTNFDKIPKNYQDVILASFAQFQIMGNELRMKNGEKPKKLDLSGLDENMAKEMLAMQAQLEKSLKM